MLDEGGEEGSSPEQFGTFIFSGLEGGYWLGCLGARYLKREWLV